MKKALVLFHCIAFFSVISFAQENQEEYKKMVEKLMKMQAEGAAQSADTAATAAYDAVMKIVSGSVMVKESEGADYIKIEGTSYYPLDPDDSVKTSYDGTAEIYFSDRGMIKLQRNTQLDLRNLGQDDASVFLKMGALVAKFEKTVKSKLFFKVYTPTAVCAIRGTEFAAEYSSLAKESSFGVFDEGQLAVSRIADDKELESVNVDKGNEITISQESKRNKVIKLAKLLKYRNSVIEARKRHSAYRKIFKPMSQEKRRKLRMYMFKKKMQENEISSPKSKIKEKIKKRRKN